MLKYVSAEQVDKALLKFRCTKDIDIQNFLQKKARIYEERGWCSTYILVNDKILSQNKTLSIDGYFTLSNKVVRLSDSISKNIRKKLFKGIKKKDGYLHFILIGQLGKFIDENSIDIHNEITAIDILDRAFEIIYQVKERITCNCVLVECKNDLKIRKIYEAYGFVELQEGNGLIQYFRII